MVPTPHTLNGTSASVSPVQLNNINNINYQDAGGYNGNGYSGNGNNGNGVNGTGYSYNRYSNGYSSNGYSANGYNSNEYNGNGFAAQRRMLPQTPLGKSICILHSSYIRVDTVP